MNQNEVIKAFIDRSNSQHQCDGDQEVVTASKAFSSIKKQINICRIFPRSDGWLSGCWTPSGWAAGSTLYFLPFLLFQFQFLFLKRKLPLLDFQFDLFFWCWSNIRTAWGTRGGTRGGCVSGFGARRFGVSNRSWYVGPWGRYLRYRIPGWTCSILDSTLLWLGTFSGCSGCSHLSHRWDCHHPSWGRCASRSWSAWGWRSAPGSLPQLWPGILRFWGASRSALGPRSPWWSPSFLLRAHSSPEKG